MQNQQCATRMVLKCQHEHEGEQSHKKKKDSKI